VDDSNSFRRGGSPEQGQVIRLRQASSVRASAAADEVRGDRSAADADLSAVDTGLSPGDLFAVLWRALADVLGTAAAATLLRRAAQRAALRWPELEGLAITRERLEYQYSVPDSWQHSSTEPPPALRDLAGELCTLLIALTGSVIVDRLAQVPELRSRGIMPELIAPRLEVPS
jgi:hypothetical protein